MEQMIPLQYIKKHMNIEIKKLHETYKVWNIAFYHAITNYGSMTLIIEQYSDTVEGAKTVDFLNYRNKIISQEQSNFPMILQQHICINHPQQILCMSLIQKCEILHRQEFLNGLYDGKFKAKINKIDKMVKASKSFEKLNIGFDSKAGFQYFLVTEYQKNAYLNFTNLRPINRPQNERNSIYKQIFSQMVTTLRQMTDQYYCQEPHIKQIFFIQDRIYKFVPKNILDAKDYFQLEFFLNIFSDEEIEIQYEPLKDIVPKDSGIKLPKTKIVPLLTLKGHPKIIYAKNIYQNLEFLDGKCLNCLAEVLYDQLSQNFISPDIKYYRLYRTNLVALKAKQNAIASESSISLSIKQKQNEVNLLIYPTINKFELINFMLAYFKCIDPVISSITYIYKENCLKLDLLNKRGQSKTFKMMFYDGYVIKDEEISIVIEKAKLKNCKLQIQFLKINDAFLYFLANSEKLLKINEVYLSDCALSENGINTLLISPFGKNIHTLSIISGSNILDSAVEAISVRSTLKNLTIINCMNSEHAYSHEFIDFSNMHFEDLVLKGVYVNLEKMLPNTLKVLELDQMVSIQDLKNLRNLCLQSLKIKLLEPVQKKSIFTSIASKFDSNLTNRANPLKLFLESNSKNTLKILDLSGSQIKYKTIRPLFSIKSLQKLILSNCLYLGDQFEPLPSWILRLNVSSNSTFTIDSLRILLEQTPILIQLNIAKTKIRKSQILNYLNITDKKRKIHINNLIVSEEQYSNRMIEKSGVENVEAVEMIIEKMIQPENQYMFNYMLHKIAKSSQVLRLQIEQYTEIDALIEHKKKLMQLQSMSTKGNSKIYWQKQTKRDALIQKIHKYLLLESKSITKFKNLFINQMHFQQIFIEDISEDIEEAETIDISHLKYQYNRSVMNFSPRVTFPKANTPIKFIVSANETIDKITIKFLDLIKNHKMLNNPIEVSLKDNKVLDRNVIKMLAHYGENRVSSIDFRGCLFTYEEVIEDIFNFVMIQNINNFEYQIHLDKDNFITNSQHYLKLFMRISSIEKLSIFIDDTQQIQILYSVLYHILDQHSTSIRSLSLDFSRIKINKDGEMLLNKIFEISNLQQLTLTIKNCIIPYSNGYSFDYEKINLLDNTLKKLKLTIPSNQFPILKLHKIEELVIQFTDQQITETILHRTLKYLSLSTLLQQLTINASNCKNICHLNKVFGGINGLGNSILEKLKNLQKLCLNFQYCPLKESSIFELIQGLHKCEKLQAVDLDLSFTINNLNELVTTIESLIHNVSQPLRMQIICVTYILAEYRQNSANYVFNRQQMTQNGVQLIL